jgi:uncharacterized protein YkwD
VTRRLLAIALALVASGVLGAAATGAAAHSGAPSARAARAQGPFGTAVLVALNHMRAQHGLPPFADDGAMNRGAAAHSQDMARHGYFAHGSWSARVARAARRPRRVGEVLAWLAPAGPQAEAAWVLSAWMHSPEHRRVLLDGGFRRVGIGRAVGVEGGAHAAIYTVDTASLG